MSTDTCTAWGRVGVYTFDSRPSPAGRIRRKACHYCAARVTTIEVIRAAPPKRVSRAPVFDHARFTKLAALRAEGLSWGVIAERVGGNSVTSRQWFYAARRRAARQLSNMESSA